MLYFTEVEKEKIKTILERFEKIYFKEEYEKTVKESGLSYKYDENYPYFYTITYYYKGSIVLCTTNNSQVITINYDLLPEFWEIVTKIYNDVTFNIERSQEEKIKILSNLK